VEGPKYDRLELKNQLCFPLYACARETVKLYKPYLDVLDLTYTQYITMLVLWEEKVVSVKVLGERLYLDSGTLTPLLKKLEAKGLIIRRRSQTDERILNVSLTKAGERLQAKAMEIPRDLGSTVNLDPQEIQQLYHLLYKLLAGTTENREDGSL